MEHIKRHAHLYTLGALFLAVLFIWYVLVVEESRGALTVAFLDVGQGDAIFIESPIGTQVLIDGGPDKKVLRELSALLPFYDRTLDALILTNPDRDHFAGFIDILERYEVAHVFEPGVEKDTSEYKDLVRHIEEEGAKHLLARRGGIFDLGGGAYIRILFPDRDVSGLDPNTGSIVAQLVYGETSVLLMGDAPSAIEGYVATLEGGALASDILKLGHHGSRTSSSDVLLGLASPSFAIISAGADNRYGHPHQEVLDTLKRFGVSALRTSEGTIVFRSDGHSLTRVR